MDRHNLIAFAAVLGLILVSVMSTPRSTRAQVAITYAAAYYQCVSAT
jgi:hypothetical protein